MKPLALLWTLLIAVACAIPGDRLPPTAILTYDKVGHFGLFVGFGFLWALALAGPAGRRAGRVFAAGVAYAVFTEVAQQTVPFINRSGDPFDALADVAGLAAGLALAFAFQQRRAPREPVAA